MTIIEGRDVIAIPQSYYDEFRRDAAKAMLDFGSTAMRARAPWFTNVEIITATARLPDLICGPRSEVQMLKGSKDEYRALVASARHPNGEPDETPLLDGISQHFVSQDQTYWHVHVDLAQNKARHGDAAGIAMGRITGEWEESTTDPLLGTYRRRFRSYEVPLAAQILAPVGDQIYIGGVTKFILQLKYSRGFNITSFSFDGFQSADQMHQLALAGMATAGMGFDPDSGQVVGMPKPFSVDRQTLPYRELLEVCNDRRIEMPNYPLLISELKRLEATEPGMPPDHPADGSKDVADPVAGVVGYLATFGHTTMEMPADVVVDREGLEQMAGERFDETDFLTESTGSDDPWGLPEEAAGFGVAGSDHLW